MAMIVMGNHDGRHDDDGGGDRDGDDHELAMLIMSMAMMAGIQDCRYRYMGIGERNKMPDLAAQRGTFRSCGRRECADDETTVQWHWCAVQCGDVSWLWPCTITVATRTHRSNHRFFGQKIRFIYTRKQNR